MVDEQLNEVWSYLVDNGYFTEEELQLVTCINGYSIDSLNSCIYARWGYQDYEQLMEEYNI